MCFILSLELFNGFYHEIIIQGFHFKDLAFEKKNEDECEIKLTALLLIKFEVTAKKATAAHCSKSDCFLVKCWQHKHLMRNKFNTYQPLRATHSFFF